MKLDVGFARNQFPAFSDPGLSKSAFFENAGGTYPCRQVVDRLIRFYRERKVQPYGEYERSIVGGKEMDEARTRLAAAIGVETDELSFGPSTTQNTYVLAQAFRSILRSGDAIVVTEQDHEANVGPWSRLADGGVTVRVWKLDPETGHLPICGLESQLDRRVKLVCFPHCSNIVGEINPVRTICRMAKDAGAWTCVDGVSYAPHGLPNVRSLGADIYLFSTYKTYGPHQGVMAVRRKLGKRLPNQGHEFNAGYPVHRLTPAGPDHAQVAASAGILDYVDLLNDHHRGTGIRPDAQCAYVAGLMREHETIVLKPLLDWLSRSNAVRLIGSDKAEEKVPTVSVLLDRPGQTVAAALSAHGIMAGGGHFYGVRCLKALGIDPTHGVLRLSFVHYTEADDVARLIDALEMVI
ncbi:MAG: aminotransferase class V-fold PLP-dependent enzyme [Rhodobacteraceae bacterium]|nr:aminotransferase class V-fold PLP-dependent enzyme [Paracoccaceae bacterium]MCY4138921.1 aminotransferase class V-fold PLP-dependent enzyme [Paracoccaceae bacterium]